MKQNDILTVAVLAISGFVISLVLCNTLLGDPDENSVTFSTIEPISNQVAEPSSEVFNAKAINPTVEVYVGQCEDWDRNGTIDDAEWQACHNTEGDNSNNNGDNGGENANSGNTRN